jgi:transcriptional regulator with PAS, ATPase and Fis domain
MAIDTLPAMHGTPARPGPAGPRPTPAEEGFGLGKSAAFRAACALVARVAPTELPLLLLGETGTGKELCARAAHARSLRRDGPFVAVNCGALPEGLLEAELFGHARGAFTGAVVARGGLVDAAAGGTLFLDEVGDASPALQARLLRLIAERRHRRVGETRERASDVRIVAATHADLEAAVAEGRFRADLWYRLAAVDVTLPPLRARGTDVLRLAHAFLAARRPGAAFDRAARAALLRYRWPGNVRELEWAVARAAALAPAGPELGVAALPPRVRDGTPPAESVGLSAELAALEARRIGEALVAAQGSPGSAARLLGLSRQGLWKKLRQARARGAS